MDALTPTLPAWVDRAMWPYPPRWLEIEGHRQHVVDEGSGPVVLLVHGTPSWAWEWRHVIADLSLDHRVVAVDHLGFGLSDKPADADYTPAAHIRRLGAAVDALGLRDVTLVVHDLGGPIGLGWGVAHPDRVAAAVAMNTFAWASRDERALWWGSKLFGSALGRYLYLQLNASPRWIAPSAWGDRRKLTPEIQRHYLGPFPTPADRMSLWVMARELGGSSDLYASIGASLGALAPGRRALVWGLADSAFGPSFLATFRGLWPDAVVTGIEGAGHFPQEEAAAEVIAAIRAAVPQP